MDLGTAALLWLLCMVGFAALVGLCWDERRSCTIFVMLGFFGAVMLLTVHG